MKQGRGLLYPASLPARLDSSPVIVGTDPRHRVFWRDTAHRCQQRQSRPGPPDAAATPDLDSLLTGTFPRLTQRRRRVVGRVR